MSELLLTSLEEDLVLGDLLGCPPIPNLSTLHHVKQGLVFDVLLMYPHAELGLEILLCTFC